MIICPSRSVSDAQALSALPAFKAAATRRDLTATNNGSEHAIRSCGVNRKIINGFRSERGADVYADIRSVVETGRRRAVRAIDAIGLTLAGTPLPPIASPPNGA
jgi:transposase